MEFVGYIASLLIGISLGLIGGGGSILTVPVLVYLFRVQPVLATAYSLFIVGSTSLVGSIPKYKGGEISLKTALVFGVPSILSVLATRAFIVPAIPDELFSLGSIAVTKSLMMMMLFAVLMVAASVSMIRNRKKSPPGKDREHRFNYPAIFAEGAVVGVLTGLVGAGGGFLIIPALVLLSNLTMQQAVGTSLLIIAAKSLIGFTGDIFNAEMNWALLFSVTGLSIAGIFIGIRISKRIPAKGLEKGFGWFALVTGLFIIVKELVFPGNGAH